MDLIKSSMTWMFSLVKLVFLFFFTRRKSHSNEGADFLSSRETEKFLSPMNKGVLLDGVSRRLSEKDSFQNVCVVARSGAGKTTKYIIPNVLDKAKRNCSIVIHDPKGEVRDLTSGYLESKGFKIVTFDPMNVSQSHFFNPCTEARGATELDQLAETLIWSGNPEKSDPIWNNGATRILIVLLKCLSFREVKYFNLPNLYHLLQHFGDMGKGLDEWIIKNCWDPARPDDPYVLNEWKGVVTGNANAVNSFASVALTALKKLSNTELRSFFSHSDYDFSRLRKEKTAIFFITPPQQQQYYAFVTSLFFKSVFSECMRRENVRGVNLPVYVMYDEFGNSYIPDFVSIANTTRGYNISLSIILQSISQLTDRYGQAGSESIQGALNTNICYAGSDPKTTAYFSNMTGIVREKQYRDIVMNQYDVRERNLLNPDKIRTMTDRQALVISKNKAPILLAVTPYYDVFKWKRAARKEPVVINQPDSYDDVELVRL